jgi:signal transduction histidine kinase
MTKGEIFHSRAKGFVLPVSLLLVAGIGFLDSHTRWEFSLFVAYAIPIFFVGIFYPSATAFGFAVLCSAIAWAVNLRMAPSPSLHSWASINRLLAFSFVAGSGIALRMQREHYRSRLDALERSRELEQEIVRISEHEQRRIGQDLHDGVCQNLAALGCAAGMLKAKLEARTADETSAAGEIQDLLKKTLMETRSLARGIFPVQIEKDGLAVALEEMAFTANRLHGQDVSIVIDGEIDIPNAETAMHLYRIAQEALSNALRHAKATAIRISLRQDAQRCTLAIKDDGSGIRAAHPKGMGMRTIHYRTRLIGGEVVISDNPPAGTLVQCFIPLPSHASQI